VSGSSTFAGFLGSWTLIVDSCDYEQGEPPRAGSYEICEREGRLEFRIEWVDHDGESHEVEFSGVPDGVPAPFAGGDLADALAVIAASPRELNSVASWRGAERMIAQRQLDESGNAMRVVQVVRFEDGTHAANTSVYKKRVFN